MNIAVTSQNFRTITGHAGKSRRFLVYTSPSVGEWVETDRLDLPKEMSMHEFKGGSHPIDAFDVLITGGCGDGFIRKMSMRGIKVIATSESDPVTAVKTYASGKALPAAEPHEHNHKH
ncbi:MAG: nitrogen fixation protein [Gammaproteobacteria bacterium]|jgi:predicted Fe-Mo cluster-binding NifX family protein|nr:nitrogen fixation protein [Gammaproteobacteria bacterium]MBT3722223.1 nitrogen fixation protein [Gammaproteobacteria bacterium]MBT4076092.1 nitrogen fixation protein [Gammaproteobacteria bacterium]MBT4193540.1 nitrogen fixation protein [Gammaproteobacteria bacterium]MBT4452201.1 nitrogen fixation protein [Gammaproteobacteria bacterium]